MKASRSPRFYHSPAFRTRRENLSAATGLNFGAKCRARPLSFSKLGKVDRERVSPTVAFCKHYTPSTLVAAPEGRRFKSSAVRPAGRGLRIGLWVVQVLLALFFLMAGLNHGVRPIAEAVKTSPWIAGIPVGLARFIGIAELAGGVGLVLPALTRVKPWLTPLAAVGCAIIMALAIPFHILRGEANVIGMHVIVVGLSLSWRTCAQDRNRVTRPLKSSGRSIGTTCDDPGPLSTSKVAPGILLATSWQTCGGVSRSCSPTMTSVGALMPPRRSNASNCR
jgi:uncharacterized membrane protein YphA (DoxX/SURF4 family)